MHTMNTETDITGRQLDQLQGRVPEPDKKTEKQSEYAPLLSLFRYAELYEYLLLVIGIIFALASGCSFPWFAYLWGKIFDAFLFKSDPQARLDEAAYYRNILFYVAIGSLFASWIAITSWIVLSERLSVKCRKAYMNSLLRQDIGWFDQRDQFKLSAQFNTDALAFQKATGEKVGSMFNIFAMFACGSIIALIVQWKMALVVLASLSIIGITCMTFFYLNYKKNSTFQQYYKQADLSAHQAIVQIKTVKSLNGQQFEERRFTDYLDLLKQQVQKWAILGGIGTGLFFFIQYSAFSFGLWYGTQCVAGTYRCSPDKSGQVYTIGNVIAVFFAIFVGSYNFLPLVPSVMAIMEGLKAAKRMYSIIDMQPTIKKNKDGIKKQKIEGKLVFESVNFAYPKQKSKNILHNLNLVLEPGAFNALVGDSGCGKSTIIQLIMRFYDPDQGRITLDGVDLKDYDLEWLRQQIGYVGQEPRLFEGTIKDNILVGNKDATDEEINEALQKAEAIGFVQGLKGKLEFNVGYGGSLLSGGQRQRIAIARAILKKPQILILDEATSALDRRNQKLIDQTLQKFSKGLTTLTIAHRIKTIYAANKIYVISKGKVIESGRFKELNRFRQLELQIEQSDQQKDYNQEGKIRQSEIMPELNNLRKRKFQIVETELPYTGSVYGRLFAYTEGNIIKLTIALISCVVAGAIHPVSGWFFGGLSNETFNIYLYSSVDTSLLSVSEAMSKAELYVLGIFLIAIFTFYPFVIQSALSTIIGQQVTEKIRKEVYRKLLRLPVQWYESKENSGGAAATRFAVDSRSVSSLVTSLASTLIMNISSMLLGIILSFVYDWRMGFVGLIAMPLLALSGYIVMLFYTGFAADSKNYFEESQKVSQEAILNIRTVYSNNYELQLEEIYERKLQYPLDLSFSKGTKLGLFYGLSQLFLLFTFSVLFYFGAAIMRDNPDVSLMNILAAIFTIISAGWYTGNNFYFMPDIGAGKQAAGNLFKILDSEDEDQIQIAWGSKLQKSTIQGNIEFKGVQFRYTQNSETVLKSINMRFDKGQKIAFVGASGCGKSTIIQLLQRFYEFEGTILIDKVDIQDYDIHYLRSHFSCVSQQPSLFVGTIRDNICYNSILSQKQVWAAAAKAEALSFIQQGQQGFNKDVGVMGSHLSGGQKQRVAIARAMARRPSILLLDEATSALDRETEKKVQKNIDKDLRDKTRLIVAHRIQTIMDADRIYLFDKGEILEHGTYKELVVVVINLPQQSIKNHTKRHKSRLNYLFIEQDHIIECEFCGHEQY